MGLSIKKSLLGVEDIHFDANGTGATAATPTSTGGSRNVHKINASHIPIVEASRAALGNTVNLDTALAYIITRLSAAAGFASITTPGLIELATSEEVNKVEGLSSLLAVTPSTLAARVATTTMPGLIQIATATEITDGADGTKAVTPATLKSALSSTTGATLPGSVISWATETVPAGYLECNGASLLRESYAGLFTAIGVCYGNADGTHFNIPDYRGRFLRGWDHGAGLDPDAATRTDRGDAVAGDSVGTKQSDGFESHRHILPMTSAQGVIPAGVFQTRATNSTYAHTHPDGSASGTYSLASSSNAVALSDAVDQVIGITETRPANVNIMYCIKY